ncbi:MAG TPA: hypothetical protein VKS22_15695 [Candidatus Binataceae bacterium]|nr:hypothetical protein [Candidatus Binataceae bacterium]
MQRLVDSDHGPFRDGLGRHGFSFAHTLCNHPLFEDVTVVYEID